jgi:undecaprenyl-diphosphatase
VILLACALVALFVANQFIELTDEVQEGETRRFDRWAVQSLRRADDPAVPIGPAWLREVGIDLTELGSDAIILLVIVAVVGFVALKRQ